MFDTDTLYIAARCWDTAPPDKWVANELRRDTNQLRQNDTFGVILDTFHDRRNGFLLLHQPARRARRSGGHRRRQPQRRLESGLGRANRPLRRRLDRRDGDPVQVAALRSGVDQVWGINIRRVIRRKNEWTHLTPCPASAGVPGGMFRLSRAGTLVGLDLPPASKNVELKPYGISPADDRPHVTPAGDQRSRAATSASTRSTA